jgi:uncharacterized protein
MNYANLAFTDPVKAAQTAQNSRQTYEKVEKHQDKSGLSADEIAFIGERDSFYMATIGENGFPYIQHRGGPKGFLKVLDNQTLAFLDFSGNKQFISVGNVATNPNASLFLMSYAQRARLKMYVQLEIQSLDAQPELVEQLQLENYKYRPERVFILHIQAFDWNCSQHITPRYTTEEIETAVAPMREYIAELEAKLKEQAKK